MLTDTPVFYHEKSERKSLLSCLLRKLHSFYYASLAPYIRHHHDVDKVMELID